MLKMSKITALFCLIFITHSTHQLTQWGTDLGEIKTDQRWQASDTATTGTARNTVSLTLLARKRHRPKATFKRKATRVLRELNQPVTCAACVLRPFRLGGRRPFCPFALDLVTVWSGAAWSRPRLISGWEPGRIASGLMLSPSCKKVVITLK